MTTSITSSAATTTKIISTTVSSTTTELFTATKELLNCDNKIENWFGDGFCDDFMNSEACQFDGGDCCQENPGNYWDSYCEVVILDNIAGTSLAISIEGFQNLFMTP